MPVYSFKEFKPVIPSSCFIAPSADLIGDIDLKENVNIWFGTVVRGDVANISIGENVNIQDMCMLHVVENMPLKIGNNVSVGHKVTLHACTVEDSCLIGMDAVLLDECVIGKNSVVAAGSVVPPRKVFPPNSMIMGAPAKVVRALTSKEINQYGNHYKSYLNYKDIYRDESKFELISK